MTRQREKSKEKKVAIDIIHVSQLAKIDLAPKEQRLYQKELEQILGYVGQLDELEVEDTKPACFAADSKNVVRADRTDDGQTLKRQDVLKNVPQREGEYFKVPSVF